MASNRIGRINEEVQRELAALIPTVKDPRVTGMISVTAVDVTPDLKYAKIFISVLDKGDSGQVLKGLKSAAGYLRRLQRKPIRCPECSQPLPLGTPFLSARMQQRNRSPIWLLSLLITCKPGKTRLP